MSLSMIVFWGVLITAAVLLYRAPNPPPAPPTSGTPEQLLAERFARSEIDEEESNQVSVLAEQANSLIANGAGEARVTDRLDDALAAPDKRGVDLSLARQALNVIGQPGHSEAADEQASALLLKSLGSTPPIGLLVAGGAVLLLASTAQAARILTALNGPPRMPCRTHPERGLTVAQSRPEGWKES